MQEFSREDLIPDYELFEVPYQGLRISWAYSYYHSSFSQPALDVMWQSQFVTTVF